MNSSQMLQVPRPYDQSLFREIPMDSSATVMEALARAHALFQGASRWLAPYRRIEILLKPPFSSFLA